MPMKITSRPSAYGFEHATEVGFNTEFEVDWITRGRHANWARVASNQWRKSSGKDWKFSVKLVEREGSRAFLLITRVPVAYHHTAPFVEAEATSVPTWKPGQ